MEVTAMQELIYYVDENDIPTGETAPKLEAHTANTRLHAAFSCYIFNDKGEFLVTQRAKSKKVWPGV
jgi:isopentenyl-diphosphate delta-isomerase